LITGSNKTNLICAFIAINQAVIVVHLTIDSLINLGQNFAFPFRFLITSWW